MRREKSLRDGVHLANAVVWGPVYSVEPVEVVGVVVCRRVRRLLRRDDDGTWGSSETAVGVDADAAAWGFPRGSIVKTGTIAGVRCVLYTGPHTTPHALCSPILKDFCRRLSPPTPRFQSPPALPLNSI